MKDALIGKKLAARAGFSTLEVVIAFAIFAIGISGVSATFRSAQTLTAESNLQYMALYLAQGQIESVRMQAHDNFANLSDASTTESIFSLQTEIQTITSTLKEVISTVEWSPDGVRTQNVELRSVVSNTH